VAILPVFTDDLDFKILPAKIHGGADHGGSGAENRLALERTPRPPRNEQAAIGMPSPLSGRADST
jgi:hypothetical protein